MITLEQARELIGTDKEFYKVWEIWKGNSIQSYNFEDFYIKIEVKEKKEQYFLQRRDKGASLCLSLKEITTNKQEAAKEYLLNQLEVAKEFMEKEPIDFQEEYLKIIKSLVETSIKLEE